MQLCGATIFDGQFLHTDAVVQIGANGTVEYLGSDVAGSCSKPAKQGSRELSYPQVDLPGGYLCPGFVDLQVNGGGGILFNDEPSLETLSLMAAAHLSLGTTAFLPTLITDEPGKIEKAVDAVATSIASGLPAIAGLHLEGPHISIAKKGAHPQQHICDMSSEHVSLLLAARRRLPVLKVTLAPESATTQQIATLKEAGIIVSLGHSAANYTVCKQAMEAGAGCVTHLYNAMSQLSSREPGLTGAALDDANVACGLIVDGHHVSYPCVRLAVSQKSPSQRLFLVSDAMAVAGSAIDEFSLQGRRVKRQQGRLTLEDGTLAGADLSLGQALINVLENCAAELPDVLAMVTSIPARIAGIDGGSICTGGPANLVWLDESFRIQRIWYHGLEQWCRVT